MIPPLASLRQRVVMPRLNRPDVWLLIATAGLVGLGLVMVFNASYFFAQDRYGDPFLYFRKHLIALGVGRGRAAGGLARAAWSGSSGSPIRCSSALRSCCCWC